MTPDNPQKWVLRHVCNTIYWLGLGDCWYEEVPRTTLHRRLYSAWMVIANVYLIIFNINQYLAYLRSDLTEKEKNDLVQFSLAMTALSSKFVCLYYHRKHIIKVLERLVEGTRLVFISPELDQACVRRTIRVCTAMVGTTYLTLLGATLDGIKVHYSEGAPYRTEVTYYPSYSASGVWVNIVRALVQFHWWFIVSMMSAIDCLCISSLVNVQYKFKVLQVYFKSLGEKVLQNVKEKTKDELADEFTKDFVVGIKLHDDALWCAKNVQRALGNLYSVQVVESVVLLVMCLVKLVAVERNLVFMLANFSYIFCLIVLTGSYMMAGGDVTYEVGAVSTAMFHCGREAVSRDLLRPLAVLASQRRQVPVYICACVIQAGAVSTAMFHCGWEAVSDGGLRHLAVVASQRSQVPVYMFAFGVLKLSYTNFISVLRSSYSFFAVMY